jgi:catechol 2,3-dioxygenase-like lactoylglutathione lyase family enzyme
MKRIGHVALFVSDLKRSRKFYEDVVELRHSETHGPDDHSNLRALNANLCFMSCGDVHHDFALVEQFDDDGKPILVEQHGLMHVAFELEDGRSLDEFAETLKAKGIEVLWEPTLHSDSPRGDGTWGGNYSVYFHDPDGHIIEVYSGMDQFIPDVDRSRVAASA